MYISLHFPCGSKMSQPCGWSTSRPLQVFLCMGQKNNAATSDLVRPGLRRSYASSNCLCCRTNIPIPATNDANTAMSIRLFNSVYVLKADGHGLPSWLYTRRRNLAKSALLIVDVFDSSSHRGSNCKLSLLNNCLSRPNNSYSLHFHLCQVVVCAKLSIEKEIR